ncbi:MAG: archaellin/type IV pilin N-terminal domain-containing protein [Haloferacaceae archaeon]
MARHGDRAVSPVVATILLVGLVILLVAMLSVGLADFGLSLSDERPEMGDGMGDSGTGVIIAVDDDPGETARHKIIFPIREGTSLDGDSLNGLQVDYLDDSADVSDVSQDDVLKAGIDEDGDGTIDTNVSGDLGSVDGKEGGDFLYAGFGGNYGLTDGDQVIVVYDGVANPAEGVYPASVYLNGYRNLARLGTIDIE